MKKNYINCNEVISLLFLVMYFFILIKIIKHDIGAWYAVVFLVVTPLLGIYFASKK